MGRVVLSLAIEGRVTVYQLLGLWRPETIDEAIEIIGRLYEEYSSGWDCTRGQLEFECVDRKDRRKILRASWLPESRQDIEELVRHVARG